MDAPNVQKALSLVFKAHQASVGHGVALGIARLWNAGFDIGQARSSWSNMRGLISLMVGRYYLASQVSGKQYYNASRLSAGLPVIPSWVAIPPVNLTDDHLSNVIDPCGLGTFLHEVKTGAQMKDAAESAKVNLTSASANLVMSGARDWINAASKADPDSQGVIRVTGGSACNFCENLASLGVTPGDHGWHNDCNCTSEPAFVSSILERV
jgi:hypothetical protein